MPNTSNFGLGISCIYLILLHFRLFVWVNNYFVFITYMKAMNDFVKPKGLVRFY